jgi:hypothetical protein
MQLWMSVAVEKWINGYSLGLAQVTKPLLSTGPMKLPQCSL